MERSLQGHRKDHREDPWNVVVRREAHRLDQPLRLHHSRASHEAVSYTQEEVFETYRADRDCPQDHVAGHSGPLARIHRRPERQRPVRCLRQASRE